MSNFPSIGEVVLDVNDKFYANGVAKYDLLLSGVPVDKSVYPKLYSTGTLTEVVSVGNIDYINNTEYYACSEDGAILYAGTYPSTLAISIDKGATFTNLLVGFQVIDIACSGDGQTIFVATFSGHGVQVSYDGGTTWGMYSSINAYSIACSGDASVVYMNDLTSTTRVQNGTPTVLRNETMLFMQCSYSGEDIYTRTTTGVISVHEAYGTSSRVIASVGFCPAPFGTSSIYISIDNIVKVSYDKGLTFTDVVTVTVGPPRRSACTSYQGDIFYVALSSSSLGVGAVGVETPTTTFTNPSIPYRIVADLTS